MLPFGVESRVVSLIEVAGLGSRKRREGARCSDFKERNGKGVYLKIWYRPLNVEMMTAKFERVYRLTFSNEQKRFGIESVVGYRIWTLCFFCRFCWELEMKNIKISSFFMCWGSTIKN